MKIVVLGGYGFVGKNVIEGLQDRDYNVIALSRRNGFDLLDYENTKSRLKEVSPNVIVNCAAHVGSLHYVTTYAADVVDDNLQMFLNLYRMIKEINYEIKVVNPISNCSYPGDANVQVESKWWNGPVHKSVWSFANAKRMWVVVSECYAMQYDIRTINFLVPNAYGPGDYTDPNKTHALNGMIIRMLQAKKSKQLEFEIWGTGKPTREWIYAKDLAKMLANAVEINHNQIQLVNIAQNKAYSIRETAEVIKELIGYKGKLVFNTNYQDGAPTKKLDDKLFKSIYPEFTFTDIKEGIKETIKYYKKTLEVE